MYHNKSLKYFVFLVLVTYQSIYTQSPYRISWKNDGLIFGCGIVASTGAFIVDRPASPLTENEINLLSINSINRFDRTAVYKYSLSASKKSDLLVGFCISAPLALILDDKSREDLAAITLMYGETIMFALSLPSYGKGIIERTRPFVYNSSVPIQEKITPDARRSFFSRHTTLAFASSVFISKVYSDYYPDSKWKPYIWTASLAAASMVGYLRYESGSHFPTDIITGAVVGSVIGFTVPLLHNIDSDEIGIVPMESGFQLMFRRTLNN